MKIYFVTSNLNKLKETRQILGDRIEHVSVDIPEIQSLDINVIITDKAKKAFAQVGGPVIVEDTGLYINAFNGFPGPLVRWLTHTADIGGICKMLSSFPDRSAYAINSYCFYDGKELKVFVGKASGSIADKPRGKKEFDWDQIFIPDGHEQTYAEMENGHKNTISARKDALAQLAQYLERKEM